VDGWGTIKLPGGTYNALRVKTTTQKSDTVYIDMLGFGIAIPSTEVVYEWYAKGEGFPVLTVNTQLGLVTNVIFSDNLVSSITENESISPARVFPNPASDILNFEWSEPEYSFDIYSVTGVLVFSTNQKPTHPLDVKMLPEGMYFIQAKSDSKTEIISFIKSR
jgi:hypothetical protein